jgi:hypothetical protein
MLILRGQSGNNTLRETADHLFGKTYLIIIFLTLLSIIILIIGNQDQMPALDVAIAIVAIGNVVALKNKYAIQQIERIMLFRLCYLAEQSKIK